MALENLEKNICSKGHHGQNIKKIREMLNIKQDLLADLIGMSQQNISRLEGKEVIEDEVLTQIAKALKVPVELIKNYDHDNTVNYIINNTTVEEGATAFTSSSLNNNESIKNVVNPLEKITELYNRLLEEKDKVIAEKELRIKELTTQLEKYRIKN